MSSKMSNDPETSDNPFEMLSDDPILHIFSFLPGTDLLELSTMNKKFKRIIIKSRGTMSKIRLVLDFDKGLDDKDLDYAIELAQTRRFTALRLEAVYLLTDANDKVKFLKLLEMLSGSVDDLTVVYEISQEFLSSLIAKFLPKLKNCKLDLGAEAAPTNVNHPPRSNVNHPLESLEILDTHASKVLQLFTGCNQLKSFCYECPYEEDANATDIMKVNNFLSAQDHLEKLTFKYEGIAWNRLKCFKLKELGAECLPSTDDELAAAKFLKKLPNLTTLDIAIGNHPSRHLMNQICRIPKLEKLTYRSWCNDDYLDEDGEVLERLTNRTVKQLHIADGTDITTTLLKIFIGVESIYLAVKAEVLDLSDVPYETIKKIKFSVEHKDYSETFDVTFSPNDLPTNVEQFELIVMTFIKEFPAFIQGIKIGHVSWRNYEAFRLSNSFCEELVNRLPKLVQLELFNSADRGRFISFLVESEARLNLENVELHEPFGAGEPNPKKMKIKTD